MKLPNRLKRSACNQLRRNFQDDLKRDEASLPTLTPRERKAAMVNIELARRFLRHLAWLEEQGRIEEDL